MLPHTHRAFPFFQCTRLLQCSEAEVCQHQQQKAQAHYATSWSKLLVRKAIGNMQDRAELRFLLLYQCTKLIRIIQWTWMQMHLFGSLDHICNAWICGRGILLGALDLNRKPLSQTTTMSYTFRDITSMPHCIVVASCTERNGNARWVWGYIVVQYK